MTASMTKTERVQAALAGGEVDWVPVSAWGHDFLREWTAEGLAEATVEAYHRFDWDFVKVNPRATYYAEDWGARYQPSGRDDHPPQLVEAGLKTAADVASLHRLNPGRGAYGEQLAALRLIAKTLGDEAPFIQTVFSPLAVMSRLAGGRHVVRGFMEEAPEALDGALSVMAETLGAYAAACLEVGASGIFYAPVEWASHDSCSEEEYRRFGRPHDLKILGSVQSASFNILHVCRNNNMLESLLDYPVHCFHWAATGSGNPRLKEIQAKSERAVAGGVTHDSTIISGTAEDLSAEARSAIAETGGRRFLLAPGCSIVPRTPEANLRAMVQAARGG